MFGWQPTWQGKIFCRTHRCEGVRRVVWRIKHTNANPWTLFDVEYPCALYSIRTFNVTSIKIWSINRSVSALLFLPTSYLESAHALLLLEHASRRRLRFNFTEKRKKTPRFCRKAQPARRMWNQKKKNRTFLRTDDRRRGKVIGLHNDVRANKNIYSLLSLKRALPWKRLFCALQSLRHQNSAADKVCLIPTPLLACCFSDYFFIKRRNSLIYYLTFLGKGQLRLVSCEF